MNSVRNGQKVAPTCPECGCRLGYIWFDNLYVHYMSTESWLSFNPTRDAKNHLCSMVGYIWKGNGDIKPLEEMTYNPYMLAK